MIAGGMDELERKVHINVFLRSIVSMFIKLLKFVFEKSPLVNSIIGFEVSGANKA